MKRKRVLWVSVVLIALLAGISGVVWCQTLEDYLKEGAQRDSLSDFRGALQAWEQGLELAGKMGRKQAAGVFLNNIGAVYRNLGDYPKALLYLGQTLKIRKEIGDRQGEGITLANIGGVYSDLGL